MIKLSELTDDQLLQMQNEAALMNTYLVVKFIIQEANKELGDLREMVMDTGTAENRDPQNVARGEIKGIVKYAAGFGLLDEVTAAIEERKRKRGH